MITKKTDLNRSLAISKSNFILLFTVSFIFLHSLLLSRDLFAYVNNLLLAEKGRSNYDIIQGDQASATERMAVSELAAYLQRISGAKFDIKNQKEQKPAIFVNSKNHPLIKDMFTHLQSRDSFSIRTRKDSTGQINIYLVGYDSTSAAFAIYTFLEDLGCRWFMPGEIGEVLPQATRLIWQVRERSEMPDFSYRETWWSYGGPKETADLFEKWKLRNKVAFPQVQHRHNLTRTVPPKKFFDQHPEYYALVNGVRQPTQLCTSNPDVIRAVIKRINEYFDEFPEVEAYSLCPDDNIDFCECSACCALDAGGMDTFFIGKPIITDRYIHFLNAVARGIQNEHPGKKVSTYAYVNYSKPPMREKIDSHVVVVFTSSVYCSAHGIGDLGCSSRQEMKRDLAGWTEAASDVYIYDYDPTPYNAELQWPLFGARFREMSDYLAMGIKGFSFESHNSWATLAPNFYVAAKVMWNANLDFDLLLEDYMQRFFAECAGPMSEYYRILEEALSSFSDYVEWGQLMYPHIFTNQVLSRCRVEIEKALAGARTEIIRKRVNTVALGFEYLDNYIKLRNSAAENLPFNDFKNKFDRCKTIIQELYAMNKDYIMLDPALDYFNRGMVEIATSGYASDFGLVTRWMLLGSFDNFDGRGHDRIYPPEKEINLQATYNGIDGNSIKWKEHVNPDYLGKIDLLTVFTDNKFVCAYAMVLVESPEKKDVEFRVGSNDQVKIWLNRKEIWNWNNPSGRLLEFDEDIIPVSLPKGKSQILLKVSNLGGMWGFCFRITDSDGYRIPDLKYLLK